MKKIISLFQRNYDGDRLIRDEVVPGAEWVLAGEGVATRKFDGIAAMVRDGKVFKRYDAKNGKTPPAGFEPTQEPDAVTGHWPGWVPVSDGPQDKWLREAYRASCLPEDELADGTYEACGPHFQGNAERLDKDQLIPHGCLIVNAPRHFGSLREWLAVNPIEGIVWHHRDGRMVKIKAKDFGIKRGKA